MMRLLLQLLLQRLRLKTKLNFSLNAKNPVILLGFLLDDSSIFDHYE